MFYQQGRNNNANTANTVSYDMSEDPYIEIKERLIHTKIQLL